MADTPLSEIKTDVAATESKIVTWAKANWLHFVTWALAAYPILSKFL